MIEGFMEKDANTMRPDAVYTPVTNAETKIPMPTLSLSGPDPRDDADYDPVQLKEGIAVEMEHTTDPAIASFIAKTHLDERSDYYIIVKREGL